MKVNLHNVHVCLKKNVSNKKYWYENILIMLCDGKKSHHVTANENVCIYEHYLEETDTDSLLDGVPRSTCTATVGCWLFKWRYTGAVF